MAAFVDSMDTDPKIERLRLALLAKLSPEERFIRMNRLCAFGRMAMLEGLREKNPDMTEHQLLVLLARNLWGDNFAAHVQGIIAGDQQ